MADAALHFVDPTNTMPIAACGRSGLGNLVRTEAVCVGLPATGTREPRRVTCKRCLRLLGREVCQ